jgi:hypothetical protein
MYQKYFVRLTDAERYQLKQIISSGEAPARKIRRAQILLKSDCSEGGPNWTYSKIIEAFDVAEMTVMQIRKDYMEGGIEKVLQRKSPNREYERRLDGEGEAHLIALVCSEPPEGYTRWSLRLLQNRIVRLGYAEQISHETIRTVLKKTNSSHG